MVKFLAAQGFVPSESQFLGVVKLLCVSARPFVSKFQMMSAILGCWPQFGSRTISEGARTSETLKRYLDEYPPMVRMVQDIELLALTGWFLRKSQ